MSFCFGQSNKIQVKPKLYYYLVDIKGLYLIIIGSIFKLMCLFIFKSQWNLTKDENAKNIKKEKQKLLPLFVYYDNLILWITIIVIQFQLFYQDVLLKVVAMSKKSNN